MTGETANPLQVLRDYRVAIASDDYLADYEAALAQVEALAEAAQNITFAIWENDDTEREAAERFRDALVPFAAHENR